MVNSVDFDQFVEKNYDEFEVEKSPLKSKKITKSPVKRSAKSPVQARQAVAERKFIEKQLSQKSVLEAADQEADAKKKALLERNAELSEAKKLRDEQRAIEAVEQQKILAELKAIDDMYS